jgi:hypothetical protein
MDIHQLSVRNNQIGGLRPHRNISQMLIHWISSSAEWITFKLEIELVAPRHTLPHHQGSSGI